MEQFQAPGAGQSIHWSLRALYLPLLRSEETPHYLGHWLRPPSRINVRLLLGYFTMSIVSPHAHCGRHVFIKKDLYCSDLAFICSVYSDFTGVQDGRHLLMEISQSKGRVINFLSATKNKATCTMSEKDEKWIWVSSCAYMNMTMPTTIEHILNLKITLWGSPSCAATRRVCKVRGIANPSENDFQWEHNSILANRLLNNIYVDKFRMVFVKTADCTHVHNSVCMPELTVGCK